jgi:hypothetical protein
VAGHLAKNSNFVRLLSKPWARSLAKFSSQD